MKLLVVPFIALSLTLTQVDSEPQPPSRPPWVPTERCSREYPVYVAGTANAAEMVCGSVRWVPFGTPSGPFPLRQITSGPSTAETWRDIRFLSPRPGPLIEVTVLEVQRNVGSQINEYIQEAEDTLPPVRMYSPTPHHDGPESRLQFKEARARDDEEGIFVRARATLMGDIRQTRNNPGSPIYQPNQSYSWLAADGRTGRWVAVQYVPGLNITRAVDGATIEGMIGALIPVGAETVYVMRAHPNDWIYFGLQP